MLHDMDSRVFILVGYRDDAGKPYALECEFTADLKAGDNFKTLYKEKLKDTELLDDWADYIGTTYGGKTGDDTQTLVHRTNRKPLAELSLNSYGEPQLPFLSESPQGTQKKIWLSQIFRSFLTISYCESIPSHQPYKRLTRFSPCRRSSTRHLPVGSL
jgi:hypothetical protein